MQLYRRLACLSLVAAALSLASPAQAEAAAAEAEVRKAVEAWARAWSERDLWGYFAAYAPEFKGRAASRAQWEAERIARISGKKAISVRLIEMQLTLSGNTAVVSFKQHYRADAVTMNHDKRLSLVKNKAGDWQITGETSL